MPFVDDVVDGVRFCGSRRGRLAIIGLSGSDEAGKLTKGLTLIDLDDLGRPKDG